MAQVASVVYSHSVHDWLCGRGAAQRSITHLRLRNGHIPMAQVLYANCPRPFLSAEGRGGQTTSGPHDNDISSKLTRGLSQVDVITPPSG